MILPIGELTIYIKPLIPNLIMADLLMDPIDFSYLDCFDGPLNGFGNVDDFSLCGLDENMCCDDGEFILAEIEKDLVRDLELKNENTTTITTTHQHHHCGDQRSYNRSINNNTTQDYIDDSDPKEDREDPEEDPADYPANGGDNDDNESSDDDDNDDDMIRSPQAEDTEAVKTDESAPTPPTPYHLVF
ncbi:hypothetical protein Tco_1509881 [Tanacetum coccineum]